MGHLSVTRETLEQSVDLGLELRNALFIAGELPQMFEPLRATEAVAEQLGDGRRRGRVAAVVTNSRWAIGDSTGAVEAIALASPTSSTTWRPRRGQPYLGQAYHALGDYDRAVAHLRARWGRSR
jgi:hypothetical protein